MFWTHGSLLVEYIKIHKKIETIWWTFDKGKGLLIQKTTYPHAFCECFKHIKGLLKHGEFSWKFCTHNFESTKIYLKNKTIFLYIQCSHGDFSNFYKTIVKDCPHTSWLLFSYFHPKVMFFLDIFYLCTTERLFGN
jgi:hypothetical protein